MLQETAAEFNGRVRIAEIRRRIGEVLNDITSLRHDAQIDPELNVGLKQASGILITELENLRNELHSFERILKGIRYS